MEERLGEDGGADRNTGGEAREEQRQDRSVEFLVTLEADDLVDNAGGSRLTLGDGLDLMLGQTRRRLVFRAVTLVRYIRHI
nr:hypothetical protein [uncultured Sphingomonas sp.]